MEMDKTVVRVIVLALLTVVLVQCDGDGEEDERRMFDSWPSFVTRKQESNLWTNNQNDELPIDNQYNLQRRVIRGHPAYRHQLRNTISTGIVTPSTPIASGSISKGPTSAPAVEDELLSDEPTCDELRTIWRLTKRAAMASMANNEVPTTSIGTFGHILHTPDPPSSSQMGAYGQVLRQPNKTKYIHGKKVYHPSEKPFGGKKVDTLRSITAGSYEQVEKQLRKGLFAEKPFVNTGKKVYASRSRNFLTGEGPIVYGTYSDKGGVIVTPQDEKYMLKKAREQQRLDKLAKTLSTMPSDASYKSKNNGQLGFSSDTSGCASVGRKQACRSSADCSCYGFYKCVNGQCNSYTSINNRDNQASVLGKWHQQAVPVPVKSPPRYSYVSNYPTLRGRDYLLINGGRDLEATPNVGYRQLYLPYYRRNP